MQLTLNIPNEIFPIKSSGWSSSQSSIDLPRHRWYVIKEAFAPEFVEAAIKHSECGKEDVIVDIFSGSGTVLLSSSLNGFSGIGFEVNPFLAFVSRTKFLQVKPSSVDHHLPSVVMNAKKGEVSPLETFSTFSEAGGVNKWLFNENVLRTFEGGWKATSNLYAPIRDLFRLALLGAAMDTCNATRDGKCLRYRKNWKTLRYGKDEFLTSFENRVKVIQTDLKECPIKNHRSTIHVGDVRQLLGNQINIPFKLCVTSPPYLNSFDYSDVYRPELFLGKFVKSNKELNSLRLKTIRSHIQISWESPKENAFGKLYEESFNQISERSELLWNKRIPSMIQAYFEDIKSILCKLHKLAKPNSSVWLVVSTSAYAGIEIPVDLIIADIGEKVGWFLREVTVLRHLRSSGQHWNRYSSPDEKKPRLRESVVILESSPIRGK